MCYDGLVVETKPFNRYIEEINRIFRTASNKHQAHQQSRKVLEDISTDPAFITKVFTRYLSSAQVLNKRHYPVVGMNVEMNADYHLVANSWIPLPNRDPDISTKAIHHHGTMLMTTATVFGPGYEHWRFTQPTVLDPDRELYTMEVTERKPHSLHDVSFVDAYEPHLPLYPSRLSITLALWSSRDKTTWVDQVKRWPLIKRNEATLRRFAQQAGLVKQLALKVIQLFDFFPTPEGFQGMPNRVEFPLGPNEDYLQSLFHILQETHNDSLAPLVEEHLNAGKVNLVNREMTQQLLTDLKRGHPIQGRLSECHLTVPHATFRGRDIEQTVTALKARKTADTPRVYLPS